MDLRVEVDDAGVAHLSLLAPSGFEEQLEATDPMEPPAPDAVPGLPLLDVLLAGSGRQWAGQRYSESVVGSRMRYISHDLREDGPWSLLEVALHDPVSGLAATVTYRRLTGVGVLRSSVTLKNDGPAPLTIESVSSFLGSGLAGPSGDLQDVDVLWAENDWQAEARWQSRNFRDALPQLSSRVQDGRSRGRFAVTSSGTWCSGTYLPMGAVVNRQTGHTLLWQIEHNGAWQWQVGEHEGAGSTISYLALLGPTDIEHHWRVELSPGATFETVPVALALGHAGLEDAVGRLTQYRRTIRRRHDDHDRLPVIFNDYLNTLNADPTTERLLPLIRAAAEAGAECFCIDAGWYAEPGEGWWDAVGEWRPSETRFTGGLAAVIEQIKADGMVPGIWIEPEVVGVRSPVAEQLPAEAFFMRSGERVVEQQRHQLDLRHPAARAHLDRTVDFLVDELGIGYIKMDYNINVAPGTDVGGLAAGAGMLDHNRAFLAWIDSVLDRYPNLTLESCASGGMRTDYALLSRFQLHSTSDQEDVLCYPPIAAAAPLAVAPEQAAVWASAQPDMSDDLIALTLCGALLGRIHLSGHIDQMASSQQALVAEAVAVYKEIRDDVAGALPFWPLGLPGWTDPWLALGMRAASATYVVVWRRDSPDTTPHAGHEISLPIAPSRTEAHPLLLYPQGSDVQLTWDEAEGELRVSLPRCPSACLIGFDRPLPTRSVR
ncbi:MAG: alpha-galactosidase [Solirubrobacteraceae bacterium]